MQNETRSYLLITAIGMILILGSCAGNRASNDSAVSSGVAQSELVAPEPSVPAPETTPSTVGYEYRISKLNGTVRIPDGYYAVDEEHELSDSACAEVGIDPAALAEAMPLLEGQTLVFPSDEQYSDSMHIYIKVKDRAYNDITLAELDQDAYELLVSMVISGFGTNSYETVEGNGLRYFVFTENQGMGNFCRYATVLNGHMIYIYANTGDRTITAKQRAVLESIALSVRHGL